jgi:hypothetical protein
LLGQLGPALADPGLSLCHSPILPCQADREIHLQADLPPSRTSSVLAGKELGGI